MGAGTTFARAGSAVPGVPGRWRGSVGSAAAGIVAGVTSRVSTRVGRPSQAPVTTRSGRAGSSAPPSSAGAIQSSGGPPGRGAVWRSGSVLPERIRRSRARVMAT